MPANGGEKKVVLAKVREMKAEEEKTKTLKAATSKQ